MNSGPKVLSKEGSKSTTDKRSANDVEIRRLQRNQDHSDGPGFGYFVINVDKRSLSINGIAIDEGMVCGPLPDFAIIELNGDYLIWWGTIEGVQHEPDKVRDLLGLLCIYLFSKARPPKRSLAEFQQYENLRENVPKTKRHKINKRASAGEEEAITAFDWCSEYDERFAACSFNFSQRLDIGSPDEVQHKVADYTSLTPEGVVLAIAAIGVSLGIQGIDYSFGDTDLYLNARHERKKGAACVGTSKTFIMPLIFDESSKNLTPEDLTNIEPAPPISFSQFQNNRDEQTKISNGNDAKIGQTDKIYGIILAVAWYNPDSESIEISYYETSAGKVSKGLARRTARNLVRNSGWLLDSWPKFGDEHWLQPAQQRGGTSGFHTVFNAWSYMLNLNTNVEPDFKLTGKFYALGLALINLGLLGVLDGFTIRAFLHCHGFLCPQDWRAVVIEENAARRELIRRHQEPSVKEHGPLYVVSALMNRDILDGVIKEKHAQDVRKGMSPRVKLPEPPEPPKVDSWKVKLSKGFRRYQAEMKSVQQPKTFRRLEDMTDEDVFTGIACVWESLRNNGVSFAFGQGLTFRFNRDKNNQNPDFGVVLAPNPLIMPLLFNKEMPTEKDEVRKKTTPKKKEKHRRQSSSSEFGFNPIGHHLFAIARRESIQDQRVRVSIFDSAPGVVDPTADIANLIRYTGWLGINSNQVSPSIEFVNELSPGQEGRNTCGFYVILNAWATMLGIPITPEIQRRPNTTSGREFLAQGLELINMAAAGCMNSSIIQAFMNHHGYSVEQNPGEPSIAATNVLTTRMDERKFTGIIDELRENELVAASAQTSNAAPRMQAPAAVDTGIVWAAETQRLHAMGYDPTEVEAALSMATGNFDTALEMLRHAAQGGPEKGGDEHDDDDLAYSSAEDEDLDYESD